MRIIFFAMVLLALTSTSVHSAGYFDIPTEAELARAFTGYDIDIMDSSTGKKLYDVDYVLYDPIDSFWYGKIGGYEFGFAAADIHLQTAVGEIYARENKLYVCGDRGGTVDVYESTSLQPMLINTHRLREVVSTK